MSLPLFGQNGGEWITSGSFKLRVGPDGQLGTFKQLPASEMPAGSGNHLFSFLNLWISGFDQANQLYISTTNGYNGKCDFSPGPLDTLTLAGFDPAGWNNVWKITRSEIREHGRNFRTPGYVVPDAIKNWPGSPAGRFNKYLAPFVDFDGNRAYNPESGDYPEIQGDEAVYFVVNDNYSEHKASGGQPLKIEVYGMLYSFTELPGIVFGRYYIVNRTSHDYHDIRVGLHTAFELGNPDDNYCGTHVPYNMAFAYNGDTLDDQHYGRQNPLAMVMLLNKNLSSVMLIHPGADTLSGMPVTPTEHRRLMDGQWKNGQGLTYGGNGTGIGPFCQFIYPGNTDPGAGLGVWAENGLPGRRSLLMNTKYSDLKAGEYLALDFALGGTVSSQGDPYGFNEVRANSVKQVFSGKGLSNRLPIRSNQIVLPNPASPGTELFNPTFTGFEHIEIWDGSGRLINTLNPRVDNTLTIEKTGIYLIRFIADNQVFTKLIFIL